MKKRQFFKIIPAVHLFLIKDDRILLLRRFNTGYEDGNYSVPAGHVDGCERASQAMIREAGEEVGIKINKRDLELVHIMHRCKEGENEERIDFFFKATEWQDKIRICEPDKCDHLEWFKLSNLAVNVIPYVKHAIKAIGQNQMYSELGW